MFEYAATAMALAGSPHHHALKYGISLTTVLAVAVAANLDTA